MNLRFVSHLFGKLYWCPILKSKNTKTKHFTIWHERDFYAEYRVLLQTRRGSVLFLESVRELYW